MKSHASMNRIYRLVWSQVLNGWVAVAESGRGRGKGASRKLVAAALSLSAAFVQAGPVGGQVISGAGSVTQSGATTTIQQASQNLSLNWQSFNIAAQETVNFVQPSASAIAVNRIFDTSGTQILGRLNANGQVYLINPNGILFGQGAQVNVGGLVASTLDLNDASLNGNSRTFSGNGTGSIVNQGTINATGTGGYVALLGNSVSNQGTITAPLGTVALGAGNAVTLNFNGNSLVNMQIDQSVLNSLAENGGLIKADGGQVFMSAGAKDALLASVVNNTGVIEARTVENHEGSIILLAGMAAGTVNVGGTLDASAPNGGNGGFIETSAATVKVADGTRVTTAAPQGNTGTWLIDPTDFTIAAGSGASTTSGIGATTLSNSLIDNSVSIVTATEGTEAGDIYVNSAVSWSTNKLTLSAHRNININANLNASGTASLSLIFGQGAVALNNTSNIITANGAAVALPAGTTSFTTLQGWDGTVKDYTVITLLGLEGSATAADLQGMNGGLGINYALGGNIDASATSAWNTGTGFTPVGNATNRFTGTFDGLGHTISNLTINLPTTDYVGLFGYAGTVSTIQNVGLVSGSVTGQDYVGGLVGENDGSINNSYATGAVIGPQYVGGLVGQNMGTVSDSYATGAVTGDYLVGGLVGYNYDGTVSDSYATGAVTGPEYVGGLVGYNYGTISNSHYNIDTVAINNVKSYVTPYGLYNAQYADWFSDKALNITDYASTLPFNNDYYEISTTQGLKDLLGFADNASYQFRLTADLDLATIRGDLDATTTSGWYIPYFAGLEFDGGGHVLSNLVVNQPMNDNIGFVGTLASGSLLNNIGLTNVSVTGFYYVGGLVGDNYGTISNSYATGAVSGTDSVGGLVGQNQGNISNSYATGAVSGDDAGGLVGDNDGTISNSYATGAVSSGGDAGGLVGQNQGNISNSYATGAVSGGNVGGLVGYSYNGMISNSYATGAVIGENYVGGLVGRGYYSTVSNSYWNITNNPGGNPTDGATGLTSAEMRTAVSFTGFNFTNTPGASGNTDWVIVNADGSLQTNDSTAVGETTPMLASEYATTINNAHQLQLMAMDLDASYTLGSNVNAAATGLIDNISTDVWGSAGFVPIGGFTRTFDGLGHTISNLSINRSTTNFVGLFGNAGTGSVIQNVGLEGGSVSGKNYVGGLVGQNMGTVSNSYATGAVIGEDYVGGLVGQNTDTVSNSYATGAVSGQSFVGGLVGNHFGTLSNSYATGAVSGDYDVGGLVGSGPGTTSNSYWNTTTSGQATSAGGVSLTSAGMKQQRNFTGFDFTNTWIGYDGYTNPLLRSFMTPLTVTANNDSKTYNGTAYNGGYGVLYSSAPNSDLLLGTPSYDGDSQGATNAGTYSITPGGLYSTSQQGYAISYVDGALTIDPANLTLSGTRAYSGLTTYAGANLSAAGVNGETFAITGTGDTSNLASKNVQTGSALVNLTGLTLGTGSGGGLTSNYNALSTTGSSVDVTAAHLTVTADNKSRLYGAANPALSSTVSGFVNGETADTAAGFDGAGSATTAASASTNAGTAVIAAGAGSLAASNYDFTNLVDGTLTIDPAAPTPEPDTLTMPASGFNSIAQLQSELRADWLTRSPSTTMTQSADTASDAAASESGQGAVGNVTMSIGNLGSTLQIVGGGMRLPDTLTNEN